MLMKRQMPYERRHHLLLLSVIILLSAFLLLFDLSARSLYVDEIIHVRIENGSLRQLFEDMTVGIGIHPILAPLIRHLWMRVAGDSDFAVRFIPVMLALLCLPILYLLAREIGGHRLAVLSTYCLAISPVFIMYSRIDKYYSQSIFATLLSSLAFIKLWEEKKRHFWAIYACSYMVLIYTHYLAALFTILGQNLLVLSFWRSDRTFVKKWLLAQILLSLTYLPWLLTAFSHTSRIYQRPAADLTVGWQALVMKGVYLIYSFNMGETIFPWEPAAIVGFPALSVVTALGFLFTCSKTYDIWSKAFAFVATFSLLPAIGGIVLSLFLFPSVPIVDLSNHFLFVLPFYRLTMAGGLLFLSKRWRWSALLIITITGAFALYNYYTARQFHNPIFIIPSREIACHLAADAQEGDIIFAAPDSGVCYYYEKLDTVAPLFSSTTEASAYIERENAKRVWLITLGRDATRGATPTEFIQWLEQDYLLSYSQGYVEQDAYYRKVKEKLLRRHVYLYKVLVRLYVRKP